MASPMKMQWSHQLHQAASDGDVVFLQQLLEQGFPPDTLGGQMCWLRGASELCTRTPLHHSAKTGHLQCVRLLLTYGADPNARDGDGYTPVHYVCQIYNPNSDIRDEVWQCLTSLIDFGGDTKATTDSGNTPLMIARQHNNAACTEELHKQEVLVQPLLVLSRCAVSALIHCHCLDSVHELWIPDSLQRYLLFEDVIAKWTKN